MKVDILHPTTGRILFSHAELESPDNGEVRLAPGFADQLLKLRLALDESMGVNCCCRSPAFNASLPNASPNSYHLTVGGRSDGTCAIDVHSKDDIYRAKLVRLALATGWAVGIYRTFVHLDRRLDYGAEPVLFYGK